MDDEKYLRRQRNKEIFLDTERRYRETDTLARSIENTVRAQKFIADGDALPPVKTAPREKVPQIIVSARRSFEAARRHASAGRKVCVLNFASATGPGGGVKHGSSAQEESLCRCSTLYPCLATPAMWEAFYAPHRAGRDRFSNDDIIYSPGITVFKSDDDFPAMLPAGDWYTVDVLTCAAPNLRHFEEDEPLAARTVIRGGALQGILEKRVRRIFEVALREGAEALVLGAFGCGAFRNPPELVAGAFRKAADEYGRWFEAIEFAVFHAGYETPNYLAFKRAFADLTGE